MSDRRRLLLPLAALVGLLGAASSVPDPTRPAIVQPVAITDESPASVLVLQSTLVSPQQRSAIINGQRYRLGDTIGDARLEAIGPGWVRLRSSAGDTELRLSFTNSTRPVNR